MRPGHLKVIFKKKKKPYQQTPLQLTRSKGHFFSLKTSKDPSYNGISFDVIKNSFSELNMLLKYLSELSLESGIFFNKLKFAREIPLFKAGDTADISNYRPISVLP